MNEVKTAISRLEKSTFSPYFFLRPRLRGAEGSGMARYLRYELDRNLPTKRNPVATTSFTNSYLEKKASATIISVRVSSSSAFDLTRDIYQSSIDMSFSDSRVSKFGDCIAPGITQVCLLRLMAPKSIISSPRFTRCAPPGPETSYAVCQSAGFGDKGRVYGYCDVIALADTVTRNTDVDFYPVDGSFEIGGKGLGRTSAIARETGEIDFPRNQRDCAYC